MSGFLLKVSAYVAARLKESRQGKNLRSHLLPCKEILLVSLEFFTFKIMIACHESSWYGKSIQELLCDLEAFKPSYKQRQATGAGDEGDLLAHSQKAQCSQCVWSMKSSMQAV